MENSAIMLKVGIMLTETQIEASSSNDYCVRAIDCLTAILLIVGASPVLVLKYLYRKCRYGLAIERVNIVGVNGKKVGLYQFTGEGVCCQWPHLFNLLKGDLSLVGLENTFYLPHMQQGFSANNNQQNTHTQTDKLLFKPGLLTFKQMHQRVGLNFEHNLAQEQVEICQAQKGATSYLMAACRIVFTSIFSNKAITNSSPVIELFKLKLSNLTMDEMLKNIIQQSKTYSSQRHQGEGLLSVEAQQSMVQYAFVNADCLNLTYKHADYLSCLQTSCKSVFADGSGIRLASQWKGYCPKDNLNGTDMFPRLCEQLQLHNMSVFLLGGEPGIADTTAENMLKRYPRLKIAGTHHGFLTTEELNQSAIDLINQSNTDVLLVAMGAPKQELWLEKHQAQLNVAVGIGVGGLFDFYSEKIIRAPLWVRQLGMEWVCRLAEEPKRMWKRYIIGNPLFLLRVLREIAQENQQRHGDNKRNTKSNPVKSEDKALTCKLLNATEPHINNSRALIRCKRQLAISKLNIKLKRMLDIVCASSLLVLLAPLFITVAILIRLESKGAVLFSQQRAGKDNTPFTMWKFRSMYQDAEQRLSKLQATNEMQGGVLFKMKKDPRITLIGKVIRKASIDELPQLWNVLCGEMSLVGPRPALLSEVKQYSLEDRRRLAVKPGITCIWQVTGRSNIPFDKQVELDVDYIYQQSLITDIWLLIKTIPAVIFARGAY